MHNSDRQLWKLWGGLLLILVVVLPFLIRREEFMIQALNFCLTMFNPI